MKKLNKFLALSLACVMTAATLAGCGAKEEAAAPATEAPAASTEAAATGDAAAAATDEGKIFNIYCWNEEFKSRVTAHYPGYEEVDGTTGKVGDITVNWHITPSDDNAYQNNLDERLLAQESAAADDKIDLFLIEAGYALKYVDTPYTMALSDLGITEDMVANQYQYTKDIVTSSDGQLKGTSWQGCPGALFYNREVAKEVFGTDDAAEVQKKVATWDEFVKTADELQAAGYKVTSSVNDTYRVYSNNVSTPWVVDGKIVIDKNIEKWTVDSKALYDKGQTGLAEQFKDDWTPGFYPEGKVFCYFGPAWMVNFSMAADQEGSIGYNGGWGITEGPQGFYWGGTWLCAATGTDNPSLVKDIMVQLTMDEKIMTDIVVQDDDFVNNKPAMELMAQDTTYSSKILGGVNPLGIYCAGAESVDLSYLSPYDQGCNEGFQEAMRNYFAGNATYEEALEIFYKDMQEKYPELSH